MLSSLIIENIAVIEHAELFIGEGFSALTGEAGAGKSILIDSLLAVQGYRTSKDLVRSGCDKGSVTALFEKIPKNISDELEEMGLSGDDDSLSVSRTITVDGKSKCRINGKPVNTAVLRQITSPLVNIHGQQDNHSLLDSSIHYIYLDRMGNYQNVLGDYLSSFKKYVELKKENDSFNMDEEEKSRRIDSLTFKIQELEAAKIVVGETEKLNREKDIINNFKKISSSLNSAYNCLSGDENCAVDLLNVAGENLSNAGSIDPAYSTLAQRLVNISIEADEISRELGVAVDSLGFDSSSVEQIEERLDLLYRLSKKYGPTEENMLENLDKYKNELKTIFTLDDEKEKYRLLLNEAAIDLKNKAANLTEQRKKTGKILSDSICKELLFMDMPNVKFEVRIEKSAFSKHGADNVEFMISTNPGEPLKPLSKVASGGELSRTMLAILSVLTDKDEIETLIFDEIDTGVSGRAAEKVARQLKKISNGKQVICITHLAQIACAAHNQYLIEKSFKNDRAFTNVKKLSRDDRIREISRIINGSNITETTLKSAEEMLSAQNN